LIGSRYSSDWSLRSMAANRESAPLPEQRNGHNLGPRKGRKQRAMGHVRERVLYEVIGHHVE
jgi:hypothetical protein